MLFVDHKSHADCPLQTANPMRIALCTLDHKSHMDWPGIEPWSFFGESALPILHPGTCSTDDSDTRLQVSSRTVRRPHLLIGVSQWLGNNVLPRNINSVAQLVTKRNAIADPQSWPVIFLIPFNHAHFSQCSNQLEGSTANISAFDRFGGHPSPLSDGYRWLIPLGRTGTGVTSLMLMLRGAIPPLYHTPARNGASLSAGTSYVRPAVPSVTDRRWWRFVNVTATGGRSMYCA